MVDFAVDTSTIRSLYEGGYLEDMVSVLKEMDDHFILSDEIKGELSNRIRRIIDHEIKAIDYWPFDQDRDTLMDRCDGIARHRLHRGIHGQEKDFSVIGIMVQYDTDYVVSEDHHLKVVADGYIIQHLRGRAKSPRALGLPGMLESICARNKKVLSISRMIKWCLDIYGKRELPYCVKEFKKGNMSMEIVKDRYRPYPKSIYKTIGIGGD
ncbi:MAG: hypothetical protein U9R75_03840 [Candidatus Thermoplasmatota archaeon]|nr:hypothetical protein [Candidatus Thermoplasmatota archaeon]